MIDHKVLIDQGDKTGGMEMLTVNVFNKQGEQVGSESINPADFGGEVKKQLLHDVVLMHLANQRAGTHSTLRRGEVAGSTKSCFAKRELVMRELVTNEPTNAVVVVPLKVQSLVIMNTIFLKKLFEQPQEWHS